jgi:TonB family protein
VTCAADFSESCAPSQAAAAQTPPPPLPTPSAGDPPRAPRSIWPLAALGAVLIHAGCVALAYEYIQPDDDAAELGTSAIDISVEPDAPHREPVNLPPGPDAEASPAAPEVMEQKTEVAQTELPKATPTESDDPDRVVAPQETKKPEDEQPKTPTVQAAPSEAAVASEATAMPSPENAKEGPRATAPELGTGESLRLARATWQKELGVHLKKHLRYPENRSQSAEVMLHAVFDRQGHVMSAEIMKSSGDPAFDNEALAMIRRSDPVPPPPPLLTDRDLSFPIPALFNEPDRNRKKRH